MVLDVALAVPQDLFIFIGVCEFLGGAGLIVPAMTGVKPRLAPFAPFLRSKGGAFLLSVPSK